MLIIKPHQEEKKIKVFIRSVLDTAGFNNIIIAVSGGIDSATSLYLLSKIVAKEHIFVTHLYYFENSIEQFERTIEPLGLNKKNIHIISIKSIVDEIARQMGLVETSENYHLRLGNIMARTRMILLYDLAKKYNALVCGTENKSEFHLGYYTRFGDAASDFEPIHSLYKTQINQLAQHLNVPKAIIEASPSAGLWEGQTDEGELGFTYEEADEVLYRYFDKKQSVEDIEKEGFKNAAQIIAACEKNSFKQNVPYILE